jgi:uncharacterized membrane protein
MSFLAPGTEDSADALDGTGNGVDVETHAIAAERLTFFTDAVVAIAMTLLALELPVPTGATNAALLHDVGHHYEDYIAFLISFMVIGAHWRAHHNMLRYLHRTTPALTQLNIYWLLLQVITPFATKVITGDGAFEVRFGFYALVQGLADVIFVIILQVMRVKGLARAGTRPPYTSATINASIIGGLFLLSIPLAVLGRWAFLLWLANPVVIGAVRRVRRHREESAEARLPQASDGVGRP